MCLISQLAPFPGIETEISCDFSTAASRRVSNLAFKLTFISLPFVALETAVLLLPEHWMWWEVT